MRGDLQISTRFQIRDKRESLTSAQVQTNARSLLEQLLLIPEFNQSKNLAAYMAVHGEMDPEIVVAHARRLGKNPYLPIVRGKRLEFAPYTENTRMLNGKFNIPVPEFSDSELIKPRQLDAVLAPLVAFDSKLNRMGMGGGFYDRSFAFRANNIDKPVLIGIAHEFQKLPALEAQSWDIPMDIIVTEKAAYRR